MFTASPSRKSFVPEYPDITVYIEALEQRIQGEVLERVRFNSPFLLRSLEPPVSAGEGKKVISLRRIGKRIAIGVEGGVWLVIHLMIAGRLHWKKVGAKLGGRQMLAAFDFPNGSLILTEAGTKKRASLHMAQGEQGLELLNPGGLEVMSISQAEFAHALTAENHTLKRALTDPQTFSGIGNAYSDEILHRAKLSSIQLTQKMTGAQITELYKSIHSVMNEWVARLRSAEFPESVTAFRPEMAAHGKYGQPCPICGDKIQRIRYANNETNYCVTCQTEGKLLADRSLSRLLGKDFPRSLEDLEAKLRKPSQ